MLVHGAFGEDVDPGVAVGGVDGGGGDDVGAVGGKEFGGWSVVG